jgi:hypothetical protein
MSLNPTMGLCDGHGDFFPSQYFNLLFCQYCTFIFFLKWKNFFSFLPTISRVGAKCFHHVMIKIRQLFLRPAACLTSTHLETTVGVLTTADAAGTNGLTCLPKHGRARDNKFWSPILWLTFENVAWLQRLHVERTHRGAIELLFKVEKHSR